MLGIRTDMERCQLAQIRRAFYIDLCIEHNISIGSRHSCPVNSCYGRLPNHYRATARNNLACTYSVNTWQDNELNCHLCTEDTLVSRIVSTDTDKTLPWSHNFLATSCKIKTIIQPYQCDVNSVTLKLSVDSFWCGSSWNKPLRDRRWRQAASTNHQYAIQYLC